MATPGAAQRLLHHPLEVPELRHVIKVHTVLAPHRRMDLVLHRFSSTIAHIIELVSTLAVNTFCIIYAPCMHERSVNFFFDLICIH